MKGCVSPAPSTAWEDDFGNTCPKAAAFISFIKSGPLLVLTSALAPCLIHHRELSLQDQEYSNAHGKFFNPD